MLTTVGAGMVSANAAPVGPAVAKRIEGRVGWVGGGRAAS